MYDTLIIGRDVSCLIAALESIRLGRKTALILEGKAETSHREGGYVFPLDPRPLSGLADLQLAATILRDISSSKTGTPSPLPMNPAFQVILPGHRVEMFQDQQQRIADLIREFPDQERKINLFYSAVEKSCRLIDKRIQEEADGLAGRPETFFRRLARLPAEIIARYALSLPKEPDASDFRRTIQAQLKFLSHLAMDGDRLPLSAGYLLSLPSRGLFSSPVGVDGWTARLRNVFTDGGGVLYERCSVIRMVTETDVIVDLEMAGAASTLRGSKLIVSSLWEKKDLLIPDIRKFFGKYLFFDPVHPSGYPFHLHIGVRAEAIPEKMAAYAVVVRDGAGALADRDVVFLATSLPGETGQAPEGRRAITATVYLENSPLRMNDQDLKEAATNMINSLEGFLPFLRENIDYLHVDKSIAISRRCHDISSLRYRTSRRPFWGMVTKAARSNNPNVLLTGAVFRAGLGFEGEILAGINAARKAGG